MPDKRLELSQELDKLIILYYKEPTAENKEKIERKRLELNTYCEQQKRQDRLIKQRGESDD